MVCLHPCRKFRALAQSTCVAGHSPVRDMIENFSGIGTLPESDREKCRSVINAYAVCVDIGKQYSVEHRKPGGNGNNQHTAAAKKTAPEELCQIDTIPPTAAEASVRKQIAERNNVSESYVARSEKFMRGVEIMEQMVPGMQEKILSGQFKVRDADMHRLARADFPNRKQIVHEILHPEDRPAPQSSYSHYSGINYSALEVAVRRIQQDFDFLMRYLPKLPDDSYAKTETLKILKQHKAYMAQFEEMLNEKEIA